MTLDELEFSTYCIGNVAQTMDVFYNSQTFKRMTDSASDLYTMSDKYLAEDVCRE